MDLRLDVSERDGWSVLAVGGEVDVATAPRLRERLVAMVGAGAHRLIVDLADVEFIDSTGLGVLIGARKRVSPHDGEVRIVCNESRIVRVFEITGLDRVFAMYDSVDDAVAP